MSKRARDAEEDGDAAADAADAARPEEVLKLALKGVESGQRTDWLVAPDAKQGMEGDEKYPPEEAVMAGELVLLASGRFGRLFRTDPTGRRSFLTPNCELVCEHGERPNSILAVS